MDLYLKRYRLVSADRMSIIFNMRGVTKNLYFGGSNRYLMVKGFYQTADRAEQEFLEAHPLFNREFVLESKELVGHADDAAPKVVEEPAAPKYKEMSFPTVKACQEYISRELGLKGYLYSSYAKCKTVLKENGIIATFENENN